MFEKTKSALAISTLVLGLAVAGETSAGGNTTANAPSTPTAAAVAAAITAATGVTTVSVVAAADGSFTVTDTSTGNTISVSSSFVATFLAAYG